MWVITPWSSIAATSQVFFLVPVVLFQLFQLVYYLLDTALVTSSRHFSLDLFKETLPGDRLSLGLTSILFTDILKAVF